MNNKSTITEGINKILNSIVGSIKIIGVDGDDGVGKSTFAKEIAEKYNYKYIGIDNYLKNKKETYFDNLKWNELSKDLKNMAEDSIVIEGILLQKVIEKIGIKPNLIIYVTKRPFLHDWLKKFSGKYVGLELKEIIKMEEDSVNRVNQSINPGSKPYKTDAFRLELYKYSYNYKPWEKADLIYER